MKQTLNTFTYTPASGASPAVAARLAADVQFQASTGEVHPPGDASHNYVTITPTVNGNDLVFPATIIDTTSDSSEPNATYTLFLVNAQGKEVGAIFERWTFDASLGASVLYSEVEARNTDKVPLRDDQAYSKTQVDLLLAGRSFSTPATPVARGVVFITGDSDTVVSTDDPRMSISGEGEGADPSASAATNTAAIQAALDAAGAAGGGIVTITKPGTYNLAVQGTDPYYAAHKYCLNILYDNVELYLGPGVTLQLGNGQQTDAGGPVNLIIGRGRSNIVIAGARDGSSVISGNAAGQPGYTDGYAQISHGLIISFYGQTGGAANSNITIRDLHLKNHFSNPINIDRNGSSNRNSNIRVERVHASDCGEGIQVISADDVWITDCLVDSPNHVSVGDAIEVSNCTKFHLNNNTVKNHRSASGFDIFGSTDGIVDNWISDDNNNAVNVHVFGGLPDPKNILVSNGLIINPRDTTGTGVCDGIELFGNTLANVRIKNVVMKGTGFSYGFQISGQVSGTKAVGPLFIEDCVIDGGVDGILGFNAISDLTIKGGSYSNMTNRGIILLYGNGLLAADVKNLVIENVKAVNNGGYGISLDNQGFTVPAIAGVIRNCCLENNTTGTLNLSGAPEALGLTIEGLTPDTISGAGGGGGIVVTGKRFVTPTGSNVATFARPSKNQEIVIVPSESRIIIDRRQAGGSNIDLAGGVDFAMSVGDRLVLQYNNDAAKWFEVSRSVNS